MILLPDEDETPVGAQVNAVIGEALRQSVADCEPSADFVARLALALDALEHGGRQGEARAEAGGQAGRNAKVGEVGGAGQGSEAAETAS